MPPQSSGGGGDSGTGNNKTSTLYSRLGVSPTATASEIARAFRQKAHELHPDRTGCDGGRFRDLNDAYKVLKDPLKRKNYDAALRGGEDVFHSSPSSSSSSAYPRPGETFDDAFERWWRSQGFGTAPPPPNDEAARKAAAAARAAAAEAWEEEKRDAAETRRRGERVRRRAAEARAERHAAILRGFWHSNPRGGARDALAAAGLLGVLASVVAAWPSPSRSPSSPRRRNDEEKKESGEGEAGATAPATAAAAVKSAAARGTRGGRAG